MLRWGNHTLPVIPNIFSTRDWFRGGHFCHAPGWGGDGLGMIQAHYIYGALYFYYYCISSTSGHQSLDQGGWDPCLRWKWLHLSPFPLARRNVQWCTILDHVCQGSKPRSLNLQDRWNLSPWPVSLTFLNTLHPDRENIYECVYTHIHSTIVYKSELQ